MSDASLFSQPSTGVLLLHTVYLTIWYISKKWVFYQFIQWFHSLFLIFIVFCLTTWFTIGEKVNPPPIQVFGREEWGLMTFSFLQGESQMWPSSLDSTLLSVRYRGWGVIRDVAYKQPVIIPPQLRGLVSFSRSLYTLQHLYDKKVWQTLFNVKATIFYTCKTHFFFSKSRPLRCRLQSLSVFVKPVGAVVILVTVTVCVSVFMCICIHACVYTTCCSPFPIFNTTECSSYTQRRGERSLNASSWSNGTTLDYNCQEWQLEKKQKPGPIPRQIILQFQQKMLLVSFPKVQNKKIWII